MRRRLKSRRQYRAHRSPWYREGALRIGVRRPEAQKNTRFNEFEDLRDLRRCWREHVDRRGEKCVLFEGSEVSA